MELILGHKLVPDLVATLVLVFAVLLTRAFLLRLARGGAATLSENQRRWSVGIRNGTWAVLVVGLFFVWAPQLHTLALSITAFAVAVVLATREVIACLVGGLIRAGTQPFKVGDWVTIEGVSGEVVDVDSMRVHLREIDLAGHTYQYTGQSHLVPNVKLLTATVGKASYLKKFVLHDVPLSVQYTPQAGRDPDALMTRLRELVEKHYAPHREQAGKYLEEMRNRTHVEVQAGEPQLFLHASEHSHYQFTVRLLLPTRQAAQIATDITSDFVRAAYEDLKRAESPAPADDSHA